MPSGGILVAARNSRLLFRSEATREIDEKLYRKRTFTSRSFELLIMSLLFSFVAFIIQMLDSGLELSVAGILICLTVFVLIVATALAGPLWEVYDRVESFMPLESLRSFESDLASAFILLESRQTGAEPAILSPQKSSTVGCPCSSEMLTEGGAGSDVAVEALFCQRGDYMDVLTYQTWRATCDALHMLTQMMGKVKLEMLDPQPEWQQVVLEAAPDGFTTGLIETPDGGFEILLSFEDLRMEASAVSGERSSFSLEDGMSISDCYAQFQEMLQAIGHPCEINPVPQEMFTSTPFPELIDPIEFDADSARRSFKQFLFARDALSEFAAPFRGKKIPPSLFWGTFDMTTALFSGKPCPYQGEGSIIEKVAFDEQFMEFGFWPGDVNTDEPAFFALAYPFPESGSSDDIGLTEAYYDPNASEYFLRLEDALGYTDPKAAVLKFCHDAFQAVAKRQEWNHIDWLTAPLLNEKRS